MGIKRLNHAVLYVRDADKSANFYRDLLDFEVVEQMQGAVFMKAANSGNHHDLGLFSIGANATDNTAGKSVGLYHLAWEVESIEELAVFKERLLKAKALVGESDHGASLSLYAMDPDGLEFEVFWPVPHSEWQARGFGTRRLQLDEEIRRRHHLL